MFDAPKMVVDWLFSEIYNLSVYIWNNGAWVGVLVIALPLLRRVVDIFRRLLG